MYPANFFNLFPPFPREKTVFVAMSFAPQFRQRWEDVIQPSIEAIEVGGEKLEAYRVDVGKVSDSILTKILDGIGRAQLFFADVTTIGKLGDTAVRNGNVMYEIGLAMAVRQPEEVVLFRSDNDPLLFDIANVRVNDYAPDDDPEGARQEVRSALTGALGELNLQRGLAVRRAGGSLTETDWIVLAMALGAAGGMTHPPLKTMDELVSAGPSVNSIGRLLDMGLLETRYTPIRPGTLDDARGSDVLRYYITGFGEAVAMASAEKLRLLAPENQEMMEQLIAEAEAGNQTT